MRSHCVELTSKLISMKKYDYRIETFEAKDFTEKDKRSRLNQTINKLGKEGWKLSHISSFTFMKKKMVIC